MLFQRILASDFPDGGTHLSFQFGEKPEKIAEPDDDAPYVQVKQEFFITAGFPGGIKAGWTQKEVADQLRKLADHLEKAVNKIENKIEKTVIKEETK